MAKIIIIPLFLSLFLLLSGCAVDNSESYYYFEGFKILPNGFVWGEITEIPLRGDNADSYIYYEKESDNFKKFHLIITTDDINKVLLKQDNLRKELQEHINDDCSEKQ